MKKFSLIYIIMALSVFASCEKMFEPKNVGEVSDEAMWIVPDMAQGVLMSVYNAIPNRPDSYDGNFLDVATDNAVTNSFSESIYRLGMGSVSSTNNPLGVWSKCYNQFQNIHMFLDKGLTDTTKYVPSNPVEDAATKERLKGEAYYLRAWWGAYLLQHVGGRTSSGEALGYPIVTKFITEKEAADFSWIKRDSYEDCVAQIVADCDAAALLLPTDAEGAYIGRATAKMAEFLKARVLLNAASPAYQPADIVTINGMGDFKVVNQEAYNAKWQDAMMQAQTVLDMCGNPQYVALQRTDIVDINQNNPVTPSHFIFRYYFQSNGMETRHYPPFYQGGCQTMPSQNLVDAYPMRSNGYPIDVEGSGYDPQNPYADRDARMDQTIYHHGSKFTDLDTCVIDSVMGGRDSESFMNGGSRASRTGYYLHKFLSHRENMLNPIQTATALHFYPTMRLAEIFLNFAEAANEVYGPTTVPPGCTASAYEIIKSIRQRAGGIVDDQYIEIAKESKDEFRKMILNERRLEFAFENFRFWDLRRRLLPLNETIKGISVTRDADGKLTYTEKVVEERGFDALRYYYLPLPYAEVQKNPQMINNMDY